MIHTLRISRICAALMLCAFFLMPTPSCTADIYKWQDENGRWHFSDSPPADASTEVESVDELQSDEDDTSPAKRTTPLAEETPAGQSAVEQGGMLWRVSRQGVRPSHLLGTIHSSDPRVVRLKPAVQQALDQCDRFVMEMQMDGAAMMGLGVRMMLTDGSDLEGLIGTRLYRQVTKAMAGFGLPEMAVRNLKPWAVMALLSMPKPTTEPILDLVLLNRASAAGKPTTGLETADEQLAVFEGLSMADQISLLKMTLDQLPELPTMFEELIKAYAADDLRRIAETASRYKSETDMAAVNRFMLRLNDERNHRMADRMVPYLDQGNSFIAIGALHLSGPAGLITLLRQRGYRVVSVR